MNLKLPFCGGSRCHLICLSSQSSNLSVWIWNCFFLGGRSATWSATWSAWALRVGIYHYESQIAIVQGGRSTTWSTWALRIGVYQYESQITIFWGRSATWSATWSAWAVRVGNYQYESQIAHLRGVDLQVQCKVICRCTVKSHLNSTTYQLSE